MTHQEKKTNYQAGIRTQVLRLVKPERCHYTKETSWRFRAKYRYKYWDGLLYNMLEFKFHNLASDR